MAYINNTAAQMPYLLSAYGLAVKHGYPGTEEQWLASLKGAKGDTPLLQYDAESGYLQYRYDETSEWVNLASLEELMTEAESDVVASAKEYADLSEAYAKGTVDGEPVPSGDTGDEDNAKYYAGQAQTSAEAADDSADAAAASATDAAGSAEAAGTYSYTASQHAAGAAQYASTASSMASNASSSAGQAGTYVETALTYRNAAYSAAADSQYYAQEAQNYAGAASNSASSAATYASSAATSAENVSAYVTAAAAAQTAAEAAQTAAETAETHAETAQDKAEDAQEAAETAQAAAEAVLESIPEDYSELSSDVTDLKSAIHNYNGAKTPADNIRFYPSSINPTTGQSSTSSTRRACALIHPILGVIAPEGYKYEVYVYDETETYLGIWDNGEYKKAVNWLTGTNYFNIPKDYYVRLIFGHSDDTNMPTSEMSLITLISDGITEGIYDYNREIPVWFTAGMWQSDGTIGTSSTYKTYWVSSFNYVYVGKGSKIRVYMTEDYRYTMRGSDSPTGATTTFMAEANDETFVSPYDYLAVVLTEYNPESTSGGRLPIGDDTQSLNLDHRFRLMYDSLAVGWERLNQYIDTPDSIATVTGEGTVRGITLTRNSDSRFTMSGTPTSTGFYKIFNVLLGNNDVGVSVSNLTPNITEPDTYTVSYKLSRENDGVRFGLKIGEESHKLLHNGDSFVIEDGQTAVLFVYVTTSAQFSTAVTVDWVLYKGADKVGMPYYESTMEDVAARGMANAAMKAINGKTIPPQLSWGQVNALARSRQMARIKWTPVSSKMPSGATSNYEAGVEYTGIPYSSVRDQDKAIGMDVSFKTFMTALHDPNSVLYTRRSTVSNSQEYYGAVCSGMINYAMGIELDLTNFFLGTWDEFETIPMQDIQPCDMLYTSGHVAMVYDVEKDVYGRTSYVTVTEEWMPLPRTVRYSWANFLDNRAGYIARRYKKLSGVPYTPIPYYQNFDETPETIVYPDVQTEFGDAAVFMKGEDVKVNVIDVKDYIDITVKLGTTTVYTTSTIAAFTLSNVQAGLYTITATGATSTSESTFFVVDATGSWDVSTGIVTFSATNATPVKIDVYDLPADREIRCEPHLITDAERTAGQANVSDLVDSTHIYAKVTFKAPYGSAVWYSETHEKWVPIT